jgi:hypothetical protein
VSSLRKRRVTTSYCLSHRRFTPLSLAPVPVVLETCRWRWQRSCPSGLPSRSRPITQNKDLRFAWLCSTRFCLSQLPAALGSSLRHRRSQPLLTRVQATRRQEHALRHIFVAAHQLGVRLRVLAGHQPSQRLPGDSQINVRAVFSSSFPSFSRASRSSFLPKTMCSIPLTQSLR